MSTLISGRRGVKSLCIEIMFFLRFPRGKPLVAHVCPLPSPSFHLLPKTKSSSPDLSTVPPPLRPRTHIVMDFDIVPAAVTGRRGEEEEEILRFLREFFLPQEPCARALGLCPHGYRWNFILGTNSGIPLKGFFFLFGARIPSLEAKISSAISCGLSMAAR